MNRSLLHNILLSISIFLVSATVSTLYSFGERTFFSPRSQSVNAVRELVGWQQQIHKPDMNYCYGVVSGTLEYTRSFRSGRIAQFLFGNKKLFFSGSQVSSRSEGDILADYFGLPFCFKSCVCVEPRISNVVCDLNWYQGFDACLSGLYLRVHLPIVHTKWDLHFKENVLQGVDDACNESAFYPAGYMGPSKIARGAMHKNVREAFEGKKIVGDREPLTFGRLFGRQTMTRIAELHVVFGYNCWSNESYHVGLNVRFALPTGNRPKSEFLFESIVGNGHHWEFGAGLTSHVVVWDFENKKSKLALYLDANVTHLFNDTQNRSYDLKNNGKGSRYMLLQEFATGSTNLQLGANGPAAPNQYTGRLLPAVNATTLATDIRIAVQGDIVLKLAYQRANGFEFDVGYNFYGRSKEKTDCRAKLPDNRYAIKGDAQLYGFDSVSVGEPPIRLNVSQSKATVRKAQGDGNFVNPNAFRNTNADTPTGAFDGAGNAVNQVNATDAASLPGVAQAQVNTSRSAILLTDNDINECSALLPRAISHKLFFHVGHIWQEKENIVPSLGAGFSAEWACSCVKDNSAYAQWGLWVKGGLSY